MPTTARHFRWDDMPKEKLNDMPRPEARDRRADDARPRLPEEGLPGAAPLARERADHLRALEGALHFWLGEDEKEEVVVRAGEVLTIPSNLPHKALALEDTLDVDVFSPPRQDWLDGTDGYLRGR